MNHIEVIAIEISRDLQIAPLQGSREEVRAQSFTPEDLQVGVRRIINFTSLADHEAGYTCLWKPDDQVGKIAIDSSSHLRPINQAVIENPQSLLRFHKRYCPSDIRASIIATTSGIFRYRLFSFSACTFLDTENGEMPAPIDIRQIKRAFAVRAGCHGQVDPRNNSI
jgi:hypothetical protein